jgi:hypothetical protein
MVALRVDLISELRCSTRVIRSCSGHRRGRSAPCDRNGSYLNLRVSRRSVLIFAAGMMAPPSSSLVDGFVLRVAVVLVQLARFHGIVSVRRCGQISGRVPLKHTAKIVQPIGT